MLSLSPWRWPQKPLAPQTFPAAAPRQSRARVALLPGCVNDLLAPDINAAAVNVLTRHGVEVVVPAGLGCCGSLVHHMGRETEALAQARANIDAFMAIDGLDAIVITASGCGTTIKDYGFMLRNDPLYAERAARVSTLAKDITEYLCRHAAEAFGRTGPGGRRCARRAKSAGSCRRLSLRLLAAARSARDAAAEGIARQS